LGVAEVDAEELVDAEGVESEEGVGAGAGCAEATSADELLIKRKLG
jgi:hypothetical protein